MDTILNPEVIDAAVNVATALGGLMLAARPVVAAFAVLAKLTPMKWDDAIANGLAKFLNLFVPRAK